MRKGFVLIIEGCDKTGKSSLAKAVGEMLKWPVLKFGQPGPRGALVEYQGALLDHEGPFVADRFHLGESVYGPIYRHTLGINQFDVRALEHQIDERGGGLLVLMEDQPDKIAARFREWDESFAKDGDIVKICDGFERQFSMARMPKIRLTWHPQLPTFVANIAYNAAWRTRLGETA